MLSKVLYCELPWAELETDSHASQVAKRSAYAARTQGKLWLPRKNRSGGFSASAIVKMGSGVAFGSVTLARFSLPIHSAAPKSLSMRALPCTQQLTFFE